MNLLPCVLKHVMFIYCHVQNTLKPHGVKQAQFYDAFGFCGSGIHIRHRAVCVCSTVGKLQKSRRNLHDLGTISRCLHSHVWCLGPGCASLSRSSWDVFRWSSHQLLQHGSLRVAGHLTCGSRNKGKSCLAFKSHKGHFCLTRTVETVRIPSRFKGREHQC